MAVKPGRSLLTSVVMDLANAKPRPVKLAAPVDTRFPRLVESVRQAQIEESKEVKYSVYGPSSADKPHVQTVKHTTHSLDDAKSHAEKLRASTPEEHHRYINVYGGGRKHFIDTRTKKWTSLKEDSSEDIDENVEKDHLFEGANLVKKAHHHGDGTFELARGFGRKISKKYQAFDVHHGEKHLGSVHNYVGHNDKKAPGSRVVTSRTEAEHWMATPREDGKNARATYHTSKSSAVQSLMRHHGINESVDLIEHDLDSDDGAITLEAYSAWDRIKRSRSTSLLPTGSRLHPLNPHKNEFHKAWNDGSSHSGGTYLLVKNSESGKHAIVSGSGSPTHYPNVGESFEAHHDQNLRHIGHLTVVHKVSHDEVHKLPPEHHKAHPLYVYK